MADSPAKLTQYEAAMHEAGHAIAALRVGYHVRDMFLASPDDDRPLRGGVWYRPSALVWDGVPGSLDGDPKNRKMAEDDCLVLAAGAWVQAKLSGGNGLLILDTNWCKSSVASAATPPPTY